MNILNKYLSIIILSLLFLNTGFCQLRQGTSLVTLEYSTAYNIGKTSDFLSKPGWAGFSFSYRSFVKNNVGLGISAGWNIFGQEDANGTSQFMYNNYNTTISGPQARYINYVPLYVNASYFFSNSPNSTVIPYIQANVGTVYAKQRLQLGANLIDNNNWHFAVGPELGCIFNIDRNSGIILDGKYNYAFSSGTAINGDASNAKSFFNINLGFSYRR